MNEAIKLLNDGAVRLLDIMGSDEDIVRAARVSYSGYNDEDQKGVRRLIRYLMRHGHTSPFEMAELKFYVKAPIFVARQWFRHRTGSYNEISGRYSTLSESYYVPEYFRGQDSENKQGSRGRIEDSKLLEDYEGTIIKGYEAYHNLMSRGVARELARAVLPVAQYTEFIYKTDLHNLLHFLKLRMDPHAQYEIRVYAEVIFKIVKEHFPLTAEAWWDYVFRASRLALPAREALNDLLDERPELRDELLARLKQRAKGYSKGELRDLAASLGLEV